MSRYIQHPEYSFEPEHYSSKWRTYFFDSILIWFSTNDELVTYHRIGGIVWTVIDGANDFYCLTGEPSPALFGLE